MRTTEKTVRYGKILGYKKMLDLTLGTYRCTVFIDSCN